MENSNWQYDQRLVRKNGSLSSAPCTPEPVQAPAVLRRARTVHVPRVELLGEELQKMTRVEDPGYLGEIVKP